MNRRRATLIIVALAAALGTAWWLFIDRLTPYEQRMVGTWRLRQRPIFLSLTLSNDHRCSRTARYPSGVSVTSGRWWVRGDQVFLDLEPSFVRRTLRPLLDRLGVSVLPVGSADTSDFDVDATNERASVWTRDSGY
jgi:hypothetical protein